jgi:phytoene desaturase
MRSVPSPKKKVVVVGAGPGGLASAMLLRAAGADVTVLERAEQVGGRNGAIRQEGYTFDIGPTFFLYPDILRDIFATCGRSLDDEVEMVRLDPMYRLQFDDGARMEATSDVQRLTEQVARIDPGDARNLPAYLKETAAKFAVFKPILERPFHNFGSLIRGDMARAFPLFRPWLTVDQDLRRWFKNPDVRLAFSFQSKYLGMSPFKCPSLFTIVAHVEYGFGVYHPIGGCNAVPRAMARVASEMGVDIRLSEPVHRLEFDGRRATGAVTGRGHYPAEAVVVNGDFATSMKALVPDRLRRRWTDAKIDAKRYSCSTFMLYLGIEGEFSDMHHHTVYLSRDYLTNIREIDAGLAPEDPTIYVQNASVTDPTLAPAGHSALYVLVPVGNLSGGVDWQALAPTYREKILDRLERLCGHNIRSKIRTEVMFTPEDWQAQLAVFRGATFNLAHNLGQMLHWRPRNRFEDLKGVYLTGGGTHPGSGLPTIFESARISSRLAAEDLGLPGKAMPSMTHLREAAE